MKRIEHNRHDSLGKQLMPIAYKPHGLAVLALENIPNLFHNPKTKVIQHPLIGKKFMCTFPSGQLFFDSKLDLDTDGSVYNLQDHTGQGGTATIWQDHSSLDADLINYFVMPGNFYQRFHIAKGDIGVVIFGIRKVYACFGDVGNPDRIGEGSIALHRELGHETIVAREAASGGRLINAGITSGVITIVFPGSGNGFGRSNAESKAIGEPLFQKLQKEANAVGDFPLSVGQSRFA